MQDRYTGDVGDFGKYGLLRCLRGPDAAPLRLAVVWYRTDCDIVATDPVNDGKHVRYLQPQHERSFRPCDPTLYDGLREIVNRGDRRVGAVAQSGLLGPDTQFHDDYVPGPATGVSREARVEPRRDWLEDALRAMRDCDLVFLDPDNGLEAPSAPITTRKAPKYAYLEEVEALVGRGQSVVIYHHLGRRGSHADQIARWTERLQRRLAPAAILPLRFRRGTARAFFVLATSDLAPVLRERATALDRPTWRAHFELMA